MDFKGIKLMDFFIIVEELVFCMEKDDICLQLMCCYFLSDLLCDVFFGVEECISLFGIYEIFMLIDNKILCVGSDMRLINKNCKDFNVSIVWYVNICINVIFMIYLFKRFLRKYYFKKLIEC